MNFWRIVSTIFTLTLVSCVVMATVDYQLLSSAAAGSCELAQGYHCRTDTLSLGKSPGLNPPEGYYSESSLGYTLFYVDRYVPILNASLNDETCVFTGVEQVNATGCASAAEELVAAGSTDCVQFKVGQVLTLLRGAMEVTAEAALGAGGPEQCLDPTYYESTIDAARVALAVTASILAAFLLLSLGLSGACLWRHRGCTVRRMF